MKNILTTFLACATTIATAQKTCNLSKNIDDNGTTLTVKITGNLNGKEIMFNRSFNVANLSREERQEFRDDILDEIADNGFEMPETPEVPEAPEAPEAPEMPERSEAPEAPEMYVFSESGMPTFQRDPHAKT
jgi:hypothetical protein